MQIKPINRFINITLAMVIAMLAACNDSSEPTNDSSGINTTVNTETTDIPNLTTKTVENPTDTAAQSKTELDKVNDQVKELQKTLNKNSQNNTELRQKISALKEKVEKNNRTIEQQESSIQ